MTIGVGIVPSPIGAADKEGAILWTTPSYQQEVKGTALLSVVKLWSIVEYHTKQLSRM